MAQSAADPDANIIFGSVINESLADEVKITVIATGFQPPASRGAARNPVQVQVPAAMSAPVVKAVPPPLPTEAKAPVRLTQQAVVPVTARAPAPRREGFTPLDEDQYDIPAFLRKGGASKE
jgi:cell division protein FtsZ